MKVATDLMHSEKEKIDAIEVSEKPDGKSPLYFIS